MHISWTWNVICLLFAVCLDVKTRTRVRKNAYREWSQMMMCYSFDITLWMDWCSCNHFDTINVQLGVKICLLCPLEGCMLFSRLQFCHRLKWHCAELKAQDSCFLFKWPICHKRHSQQVNKALVYFLFAELLLSWQETNLKILFFWKTIFLFYIQVNPKWTNTYLQRLSSWCFIFFKSEDGDVLRRWTLEFTRAGSCTRQVGS